MIQDTLTPNLNFNQIWNAMVILFVMSTGEAFYEIQKAVSMKRGIEYQCIENPNYHDYLNNNKQTIGCGDSFSAVPIFLFFVIVVILIFLNLFIAIIIQGYTETVDRNNKLFDTEVQERFKEVWSYYDQDAVGFIDIEDFPNFMIQLDSPLGWDNSFLDDEEKQHVFIQKMGFPTYNDFKQYSFIDVIENLVMFHIVQQELQKYLDEQVLFQKNAPLSITLDEKEKSLVQKNEDELINAFKSKFKDAEQKKEVELVRVIRKKTTSLNQKKLKSMDRKFSDNDKLRILSEKLRKSKIKRAATLAKEQLSQFIINDPIKEEKKEDESQQIKILSSLSKSNGSSSSSSIYYQQYQIEDREMYDSMHQQQQRDQRQNINLENDNENQQFEEVKVVIDDQQTKIKKLHSGNYLNTKFHDLLDSDVFKSPSKFYRNRSLIYKQDRSNEGYGLRGSIFESTYKPLVKIEENKQEDDYFNEIVKKFRQNQKRQ